jgi:hypothetical protein
LPKRGILPPFGKGGISISIPLKEYFTHSLTRRPIKTKGKSYHPLPVASYLIPPSWFIINPMMFRNVTALITGADCFIGSHLTGAPGKEGAKVKALSRCNSFNNPA